MKYLFFASMGPVQSFIAAARKVRDLYAGSWILSEVAKPKRATAIGTVARDTPMRRGLKQDESSGSSKPVNLSRATPR